MTNLVDFISPIERAAQKMMARDMQYQPQGGAPSVMRASMRRLGPQELLAAAIQQGELVVVDAAHFTVVTGLATPRRYDRIIDGGMTYAVERWDGAGRLAAGGFTFWKITVLGGQQ
jgi:hypothetical protein